MNLIWFSQQLNSTQTIHFHALKKAGRVNWIGFNKILYYCSHTFHATKKKSVSCWPSSGFVSLTVGVQHRSLLRSKLGANYSHAYAVVFRDCIDVLFVLRNGEIKAFTVDHMNRTGLCHTDKSDSTVYESSSNEKLEFTWTVRRPNY